MPPIEALRRHGVPIAVSTDCNPGSSPLTSLLLTMNMGATLFRLTTPVPKLFRLPREEYGKKSDRGCNRKCNRIVAVL